MQMEKPSPAHTTWIRNWASHYKGLARNTSRGNVFKGWSWCTYKKEYQYMWNISEDILAMLCCYYGFRNGGLGAGTGVLSYKVTPESRFVLILPFIFFLVNRIWSSAPITTTISPAQTTSGAADRVAASSLLPIISIITMITLISNSLHHPAFSSNLNNPYLRSTRKLLRNRLQRLQQSRNQVRTMSSGNRERLSMYDSLWADSGAV
jgi:hypothetical protein